MISTQWWMVASPIVMAIAALTTAGATVALSLSDRSKAGSRRGQQDDVAYRTMQIVLQLGVIHAALGQLAKARYEDPAAAAALVNGEIREHLRAACSEVGGIIPQAAQSNPAMVPALHRAGWFAASLDKRFKEVGRDNSANGLQGLPEIRRNVEGLGSVLYYAVRRGGGRDRLAGRLEEYLDPFRAHHAAVSQTIEGGGHLISMFGDAA